MKRVIILLGMLVALSSTFLKALAYDFEVDGLYYDLISASERTCAFTKGDKPYEGVVNIPDSVLVNGRYVKVIKIKRDALDGINISELTIPGSILEIERLFMCNIGKINILYGKKALIAYYSEYSIFNKIHVKEMFIDRDIIAKTIQNNDIEKITIGKNLINFDGIIISSALKSIYIEEGSVPIARKDYATINGPITYAYIGRDGLEIYTQEKAEHLIFGKNATRTGVYGNCENLTTVEMNNIQIINNFAFSGCKKLANINFPKTLKRIEIESFSGSGIKELILDSNLDYIDRCAFQGCNQLEKIQIKKVEAIAFCAFDGCCKVRTVILGEGVKRIDDYAFCRNYSLKEIELPNSLKSVGHNAFQYCDSLKTIKIGDCIEKIDRYAFADCKSIESIVISATVPPQIDDDTFDIKTYLNCTLYVPTESIDLYKDAYGWKGFWNIKGIETYSSVKEDIVKNENVISILPTHRCVRVLNKDKNSIVRVFSIQGTLIKETRDDEINNLPVGLYVVKVGNKSFKVSLR